MNKRISICFTFFILLADHYTYSFANHLPDTSEYQCVA